MNLYRKFKADGIFSGTRFIPGDPVLITSAEGKVIDIINSTDAGDDIEQLKGILCPGFINCHCHIELSFLRNVIPIHTGLIDFVLAVLSNRSASLEVKLQAMESAASELYESGTVAVGDICNNADSIALKKISPLYWYNFIEVSGFVDATAEKRISDAQLVAKEFSTLRFPYSVVPHAPYSVSKKLFQLLNSGSAGQLISIHNQEERSENELYQHKTGTFLKLYDKLGIDISGFLPTGKTSLQSWLPYFNNGQKIISVHNTFTTAEEIGYNNNFYFCICINANLYIENSLPPVKMLINNNCNIVLGTDSYASNLHLNMLEEMKTIQKYFPHLETDAILKWATSNGAEALEIDHTHGSIEKGKTPGLVLINEMVEGKFSPASRAVRII